MSVDDHDEDITMGEEQKFCCTHDGCGKSYKQKRNLMIHVKLDHCDPSEMRLYECSEEGCGRVFKYKCALNRHNILYHMGPEIREAHLCKRRKNQVSPLSIFENLGPNINTNYVLSNTLRSQRCWILTKISVGVCWSVLWRATPTLSCSSAATSRATVSLPPRVV